MQKTNLTIDPTHFKSYNHVKHALPNMKPAEVKKDD